MNNTGFYDWMNKLLIVVLIEKMKQTIHEFSLKRAIFVKIEAERIFEPELTRC